MWRPVDRHNGSVVQHHHHHHYHYQSSSATLHYYTLVGQTFFRPTELRFQELTLMTHQLIVVHAGDVLGLHAAQFNPLAWTAVPCGADPRQRHRYARPAAVLASTPAPSVSTGGGLEIGRTVAFRSAADKPHPCRQYSLTALFGEFTMCLSTGTQLQASVRGYGD